MAWTCQKCGVVPDEGGEYEEYGMKRPCQRCKTIPCEICGAIISSETSQIGTRTIKKSSSAGRVQVTFHHCASTGCLEKSRIMKTTNKVSNQPKKTDQRP